MNYKREGFDAGIMVLETERLYLREMNMDDFDALYAVLADPDIMTMDSVCGLCVLRRREQ